MHSSVGRSLRLFREDLSSGIGTAAYTTQLLKRCGADGSLIIEKDQDPQPGSDDDDDDSREHNPSSLLLLLLLLKCGASSSADV